MTSALARAGVCVTLVTADGTAARPADLTNWDRGVPLHRLPSPAHLGKWVRDAAPGFDLIHVHSLWNRPTAAACAAGRATRVPYVLRPCGMLSAYSWQRHWAKKRAYWWAVERRNVRGASAFHATSPGELHDIRAAGVTAPVFDIPLGLEDAAFTTPPSRDWLRQRCGSAVGDRPIVLFLSRLHPKKGVADVLIPAFASVKSDAFLAIVGGVDDSTPAYGDIVRQAIAKHGLTDRVAVLGAVSVADRWAAFDGAAVFVLPSHSENFGLVVTEAMARGCPVVVTDQVQSHEHVTASGGGLVVPVEAGAVAAAISRSIDYTAIRATVGSAARRYAREAFCWDRLAHRISEMYRAVLQSSVRA
jgi:glycosyltransferase involved in cell wall biosynthesis